MTSYKTWACAALAAGLLLWAGCGGEKAAGLSEGGAVSVTMKPLQLSQVAAADNQHGRTIMWELEKNVPASVEYRTEGGAVERVEAKSQLLKGSQGEPDRYVYEASLTGLKSGTAYEYRTRTGNSVSQWHAMKTEDGGDFTALIFPDSQSLDYSVWKATAQAGRKKAQEAQFFIQMGDLTDNGQDEHQWQSWFAAAEPMISDIPVAPVMGNHEAYSLDWKMARPDRYAAHFALPENGVKDMPELFYSFDWGDVHFTVLNTQMTELADFYPNLLEAQKDWLEKDLQNTQKKWKVVLMHKDPLQYRIAKRPERKEGFSPEGEAFMPIFDANGVDAVLSAHLHTYRDRGHIYDFKRSAEGPLYVITGVAGDVRYPNLWTDHALDIYVAPQPETDNFLTMEATEDHLLFRGYLVDGTLLHESEVKK